MVSVQPEEYTNEVTKALVSNSVELENDTIVIRVAGNQDVESIRQIDKKAIELTAKLGFKPNILIDVTNSGLPDKEARKLIVESFSRDDYNLQAIFGLNDALRVVAKVILRKVFIRDRTKMFKNEIAARVWLRNHQASKYNRLK